MNKENDSAAYALGVILGVVLTAILILLGLLFVGLSVEHYSGSVALGSFAFVVSAYLLGYLLDKFIGFL